MDNNSKLNEAFIRSNISEHIILSAMFFNLNLYIIIFQKAMFKKILYVVLGLFIIINVILAFQAYRSTYFYEQNTIDYTHFKDKKGLDKWSSILLGAKTPKRPIADFPKTAYQTLTFKDSEGYVLEAWYLPVPKSKGTVALFHGHSSNKGMLLCEAETFQALGYNTLSVDARSHGNSQGNICTIGYKEAEQVKLAHDWLAGKGEHNIIYWGASMGASTILRAIPQYNLKPSKVILNCPFASMHDGVKGFLRNMNLPTEPLATGLMVWGSILRGTNTFNYIPAEYAKTLSIPVLLLWGAKDNRVLRYETDLIFKNLGSTQKKLAVFEQSGHQSYCKSEPELWRKQVEEFLK